METKGKSSLICLAVSHLIGQSLVVVKECLVRLPTTALLLWGNLSRDQLLQKACYAIKTFLTLKKLWHPKHFCVTFMYPKKQTKKMNKLNYKLRRKRLTKINEKGAVTKDASIYATFYFDFVFTLTQKRSVKNYLFEWVVAHFVTKVFCP